MGGIRQLWIGEGSAVTRPLDPPTVAGLVKPARSTSQVGRKGVRQLEGAPQEQGQGDQDLGAAETEAQGKDE